MAHYIDAEKLKERIEKLDMESCISEELSGFYYGIERVLEVIDSFQQEHPEVDLEKEIEEYFGEDWKDGTPIEVQDDMIQFARHFYELSLNARKED